MTYPSPANTFFAYTFTSPSMSFSGNAVLKQLDEVREVETTDPIAVFSNPVEMFKFMTSDSRMYECECYWPVTAYTEYVEPKPQRSSPKLGAKGQSGGGALGMCGSYTFEGPFEPRTGTPCIMTVQRIDMGQSIPPDTYIDTPEFLAWYVYTAIVNDDWSRICVGRMSENQHNAFIGSRPFEHIIQYIGKYSAITVGSILRYHELKFVKWLEENDLEESQLEHVELMLATLLPHKYMDSDNDTLKRAARMEMAKLQPIIYLTSQDDAVRRVAVENCYATYGTSMSEYFPLAGETSYDIKRFLINKKVFISEFYDDDDLLIAAYARSKRNSWRDRLWAWYNKGKLNALSNSK